MYVLSEMLTLRFEYVCVCKCPQTETSENVHKSSEFDSEILSRAILLAREKQVQLPVT